VTFKKQAVVGASVFEKRENKKEARRIPTRMRKWEVHPSEEERRQEIPRKGVVGEGKFVSREKGEMERVITEKESQQVNLTGG